MLYVAFQIICCSSDADDIVFPFFFGMDNNCGDNGDDIVAFDVDVDVDVDFVVIRICPTLFVADVDVDADADADVGVGPTG